MQEETCKYSNQPCSQRDCLEYLRKEIAIDGGRVTAAKRILMQVICDLNEHFTPIDLHQRVTELGHSMDLTTIYRNLAELSRHGIVQRTTLQEENNSGAVAYEHAFGRKHHDHLVCSHCGHMVEFHYGAIEVLQEEVARQHGFELHSHHMELVGICSECNGKQQGT